MHEVRPSEVVELIEAQLPGVAVARRTETGGVSSGSSAGVVRKNNSQRLVAILTAAEAVPDVLLGTLAHQDHTTYLLALAMLREGLDAWKAGGDQAIGAQQWPGLGGHNPLALVHLFLSECQDEVIPSSVQELPWIVDRALAETIRQDLHEAESAIEERRWKTATVFFGAAIEALLLEALNRAHPSKKSGLRSAGLAELRKEAKAAQLIMGETAGLVETIGKFRNLIHPGRAQRLDTSCDRGTAHGALAAAEHVMRDLQR